MDAVTDGRVKIIPDRYAKSYLDWLSEKRDWPIGRQLWWGHRIPVWSKRLGVAGSNAASIAAADADVTSRLKNNWKECLQFQVVHASETGTTVRFACVRPGYPDVEKALESAGYVQESDVLDTWFSSALWPHSTLGWPEQTPELKYYYPTSVLITSRDIITLWVARMVLAGLHNLGEVPFHDVFIHPKILDGFGEGMSKSKGNGVDPVDVMEKFGADALRFGLAYLTTETQDIRMPVTFECPHCQGLIEQTKENRTKPKLKCKHCHKEFSTQWAKKPADVALPRGAVVSERFEVARNFCNKLWNASRFAMMNLDGFAPAKVDEKALLVEDRWLLSRLSTVTRQVTDCLARYQYADAARVLYEFSWDEFCSFYVEMVKGRLQDPATRPLAQRVLAHTLDVLLRLLHPMIPFLTEEVWHLLGGIAPRRGLEPKPAVESVMVAAWPESVASHQDPQIEAQFAQFQNALRAIREVRSRQNVPPKQAIEFSVRCDEATAALLAPMESYFVAMAGAKPTSWGAEVTAPALSANTTLPGMEIYVDLAELIDVAAEIAKKQDELGKLEGRIAAQEKKLGNESFIQRAPAAVVQKERDTLADLRQQMTTIAAALEHLGKLRK
jgi:valyl-tRNA synthetase